MQRFLILATALAGLAALPATPALAAKIPARVGECVQTTITEVGSRLEGVPESGSAVAYANGVFGVSYDTVKALGRARVGDRVKLCLTSIPKGCPPGDDRGKTYSALDARTKGTWDLPDAEHMCGGA